MYSKSFDSQQIPTGRIIGWDTKQPTKINIVSFKLDYVHPFSPKTKLESGLKFSNVKTDNKIEFNNLENNIWNPDPLRSDHFIYKETISAAYASLSHQF